MVQKYFHNKVAVISGASSGIGKELALHLANDGAKVVLAARNEAALNDLTEKIRQLGGVALPVPTNVTQPAEVQKLIQETINQFSTIDYLFSNAGQYLRSRIVELKPETLKLSMDINYYSHVYMTLAVLPHMLKRQQGHIIFVASMDAKKGLPLDAPYVSAKYALAGFGDVLRQELYQSGVKVTIAYPGRVDTPMINHLKVPWISAKISAKECAQGILNGVRKNKAEIILPPQTYLLYYLQVFSPRLADYAVRVFNLEGTEVTKEGLP
ncbi:MAG: SDR family NAD(P)-dependent oxidoreductase [Anaerolineales bacterium]